MKRVFFGLVAIGSGVVALHFLTRFLQIRDTTNCYTDQRCQQMVLRGGETRHDRELAIGFFALAGISIWIAGSSDPA